MQTSSSEAVVGVGAPVNQSSANTQGSYYVSSGPGAGGRQGPGGAPGSKEQAAIIYVDDDMDLPSDSEDEEERMDLVHAIHGDGTEADAEEEEEDTHSEKFNDRGPSMGAPSNHYNDADADDTILMTERRTLNDEDMDGDIEDADGLETERRGENSLDRANSSLEKKKM